MASWDDALGLGEQYGYRNAQTTVIAPTGTIGLLMDCDTTGVEPDFALTKFKKLAGGGYFKIANQSLRPALTALGYEKAQVDDIVRYVMGTLSLDTPMPLEARKHGNTVREFLTSKGYTGEQLVQVENDLPTVFELGFAFNAWTMPAEVLAACNIEEDTARNDPSFNGLKALGLTQSQIDELNMVICGTQTIEGAPHLKPEHLPIFDCANKCGAIGTRFIAPEGHIRMMAAAQPFITGAISKTINLPREATEDDIAACYWLSWELGLKANALYRDGCKLSQPLNTKSDADHESDDEEAVEAALGEVSTEVADVASAISTSSTSSVVLDDDEVMDDDEMDDEPETQYVERIVERIIERPMRKRLPDTRDSVTHHFNVAGHEGYLTVGMYKNGAPGELFITMSKEGSTIGGLMDSLGTAISVALQYGVPVSSLVKKFEHARFEPMGMTTNQDIPFAKSLVDYIFRWLGMEFIPGFREANAPQRPTTTKHTKTKSQDDSTAKPTVKEDNAWSSTRGVRAVAPAPDATPDTTPDASPDAPPDASRISTHGNGTRLEPGDSAKTGAVSSEVIVEAMIARRDGAGATSIVAGEVVVSALDQSTAALMGDAPACEECGSITVRNGACYKCLNCGNSMGCS